MLIKPNPYQVRLYGYEEHRDVLEKKLKYVDQKVDYELRKFKGNRWFLQKHGEEAYTEKLAELKEARNKSMLFEDEEGLWTYSGLAPMIADEFDDRIELGYKLPEPKPIPFAKKPSKAARYYQTDAHERLLALGHGGVEIGTGLGKSFIILMLCKSLGLQTVIMSPSINIAEQLYDELATAFGTKYVGMVGGGKKKYDKLFTVAVGASLAVMKPGTPAWEKLSKAQVFIADESHMTPAKTLQEVCFGLLKHAPYRFFFSATQMRGDGLGLLLEGIVGKIVYTMTVREGVDQGFLTKPTFRMLRMKSGQPNLASDDPNDLTRHHLFYNPKVNAFAADVANKSVGLQHRPTLILIDEIEQFTKLLPFLRYEARFAHGPLSAEQKAKVPSQYHDSEPKKLVEAFNRLEYPILVGTSCIATGTDIQAVQTCIYLRGGKSEVEVRQGVGRTTRLFPNKKDCVFLDFCIDDVETLARHAMARKEIYQDLYPSYEELKIA